MPSVSIRQKDHPIPNEKIGEQLGTAVYSGLSRYEGKMVIFSRDRFAVILVQAPESNLDRFIQKIWDQLPTVK